MNTYRRIKREEIQANIELKKPMHTVEALPEKVYRENHLPGAIKVPHDEVRDHAERLFPNKNDFIVVYRANTPCQNS